MLWEGGLHMNLRQINELWNEYKEKYDLPKDTNCRIRLDCASGTIYG